MSVLCVAPCFPSSQEFGGSLMSVQGIREITEDARANIRIALEAELAKIMNSPGLSSHVKQYEEAVYRAAASPVAYFDLLEQMFDTFVQRLRQTCGLMLQGSMADQGLNTAGNHVGIPSNLGQVNSAELLQNVSGPNDLSPVSSSLLQLPTQHSFANHYGTLLSSSPSIWQNSSTIQADFGATTAGRIAALHTKGSSTSQHILSSASSGTLSSALLSSSHSLSTTQAAATMQLLQPATKVLAGPAGLISNLGVLQPLQNAAHSQHVPHLSSNGMQATCHLSSANYVSSYMAPMGRPNSADSHVGLRPGSAYSSTDVPLMAAALHSGDLASEAGDAPASECGSGMENLPMEWQLAREQLLHYQLAGDDDDEDEAPPCPPCPQLLSSHVLSQPAYARYNLQTAPGHIVLPDNLYQVTSNGHGAHRAPVWQPNVPNVLSQYNHLGVQQQGQVYTACLPHMQEALCTVHMSSNSSLVSSDPHMMLSSQLRPQTHQHSLGLRSDQAGVASVGPAASQAVDWAEARELSLINTLLRSP